MSEQITPKPIFVARVCFQNYQIKNEQYSRIFCEHISEHLIEKLSDEYHVLVLAEVNSEYRNNNIIFESFYPSDFDIKSFEDLKLQILEDLETLKQKQDEVTSI